ncbi:unnamed protein product, partial [Polarella glacialis]
AAAAAHHHHHLEEAEALGEEACGGGGAQQEDPSQQEEVLPSPVTSCLLLSQPSSQVLSQPSPRPSPGQSTQRSGYDRHLQVESGHPEAWEAALGQAAQMSPEAAHLSE